MTAFNDFNTVRVRCRVYVHGAKHTTKVRVIAGATPEMIREAQTRVALSYQRMEDKLGSDFACLGVEYAPAGQPNYIEVEPALTWSEIAGEVSALKADTAKSLSISGKDSQGNSTSVFFWGIGLVAVSASSNDYRFVPAEDTDVTPVKAILDGTEPLLVGRSGALLVFKPYLNARVNAYWQSELRK